MAVKAKQSLLWVNKTKIPVCTRGCVSSAALHFSYLGLRHLKKPQVWSHVYQKAVGGCPAGSCEGVGPILMHKLFHSFLSILCLSEGKLLGLGLPPQQLVLGDLLLSTGSASQHRSCISQTLCVQHMSSGHSGLSLIEPQVNTPS